MNRKEQLHTEALTCSLSRARTTGGWRDLTMDDQSDDQLLKELEVRPARHAMLLWRQREIATS